MSYFSAKRIGEMLAMVRVSAGLSQTDMARRINKGRATVQSWECGASSPPADKIMDWFEACGCSPLAPFQEMLHPDLYRKLPSALTDEELDAALAAYFDTAPRMVKEMLLFYRPWRAWQLPASRDRRGVRKPAHAPAEQSLSVRAGHRQLHLRCSYQNRPGARCIAPATGAASGRLQGRKAGRPERKERLYHKAR